MLWKITILSKPKISYCIFSIEKLTLFSGELGSKKQKIGVKFMNKTVILPLFRRVNIKFYNFWTLQLLSPITLLQKWWFGLKFMLSLVCGVMLVVCYCTNSINVVEFRVIMLVAESQVKLTIIHKLICKFNYTVNMH